MTATASRQTQMYNLRPMWSLARRLGAQAALSVTVMAGLQFASVNGYDIRDLLPVPGTDAVRSYEPERVAGMPEPLAIPVPAPVPAGSTLDRVLPKPLAEAVTAARIPSELAPQAVATQVAGSLVLAAAQPQLDRVAVPTPRPRSAPARSAAVSPRPNDMSFDVTARGVEVYGVPELGGEDVPPMPLQIADAGFHVSSLVPSGEAILTRTVEVTGSAVHAVTGTATSILDLVR